MMAPRAPPFGHIRYYSLDGMRGFAAIIVLLHHFGLQLCPTLAPRGYLAVDFFFTLSGFVVALAYQDRLNRGLTAARFMALRVARLYPLFLVGIGLGIAKAAGQIVLHDSTALPVAVLALSVLLSILMLPTPVPGLVSIFPLNTPGWSLFFEIAANLVLAVGVARWPTRRIALAAACSGFMLAIGIWTHGGRVGPLGTNWSEFAWGFPRVAYAFLTGVLLFRLSIGRQRRASAKIYVAIAGLIALLLAGPQGWMRNYYEILVLGGAVPAIIWLGIMWEVPRANWRLFAWLGDISYPLYVLHFPLLMVYLFIARMTHLSAVTTGVTFTLVMLTLSSLALRFYDLPARALLCRRLKRWGGIRSSQALDQAGPKTIDALSTRLAHAGQIPTLISTMQR
jgi:peptidoglycan/LPS O-acetylase OafA/YrhL